LYVYQYIRFFAKVNRHSQFRKYVQETGFIFHFSVQYYFFTGSFLLTFRFSKAIIEAYSNCGGGSFMAGKIITISREFGSGGRSIGREVAQRLGIPFYDKELVEQVALESGFAPQFVEEHGEHAPTRSRLSYLFSHQGVPGVMNGMSTADFL
jgi:hypothetical protein